MSFLPLNQQRQGTEVVENDATGSVAEDGREGAMSKSPSAGADKFKDLVKKHGAAFHVAGMLEDLVKKHGAAFHVAGMLEDLVKKHGAAFHVAGMLKATRDERPEKALVPAPRSQLVSFVFRLLNCQ